MRDRRRRCEGGQCARHVGEIEQGIAEQSAQREAILVAGREMEPALGEATRGIVAVFAPLRRCGIEIGARRAGILSPVQMRGVKRRIARREPFRRAGEARAGGS